LGIYAQKCISVFNKINEQVRLSQQWKADVLDGYSGALLLLAKEVERRGVKDIRPRLMFGSADLIDAPTRRYLEEVFKAPYHDQYGCSEVNRTAWQCPERTGYHMDVDSVITQFVDDEGHDVSEGETGEIVHTSLFNFAMPFIRYSIRDRGRPSSETCPCGRVFPLMEVVEGRRDSFISLPDGRIMSPRAFTVAMRMFEYYDNIEWFRIVQKKPNVFEVYLKPKKSLNEELIKAKLESHFAKVLDLPDIEVNVELSDDIPLSKGGKLMAVVSEVEPKN
jgi:phenylacetate-CoA ligase